MAEKLQSTQRIWAVGGGGWRPVRSAVGEGICVESKIRTRLFCGRTERMFPSATKTRFDVAATPCTPPTVDWDMVYTPPAKMGCPITPRAAWKFWKPV